MPPKPKQNKSATEESQIPAILKSFQVTVKAYHKLSFKKGDDNIIISPNPTLVQDKNISSPSAENNSKLSKSKRKNDTNTDRKAKETANDLNQSTTKATENSTMSESKISEKKYNFGSTTPSEEQSMDISKEYYLRIVCDWLECCVTTENLGSSVLPFKDDPSSDNQQVATYFYDCDPNLKKDTFTKFNERPGLYVFLLRRSDTLDDELYGKPISFAYVDCSSLAVAAGELSSVSCWIDGLLLNLTVTSTTSLFSQEDISLLNPLVLNIHGLTHFPKPKKKPIDQYLNSFYLYNNFSMNNGIKRHIYGKPKISNIDQHPSIHHDLDSDDSDQESVDEEHLTVLIDLSVTLFPKLFDYKLFEESLTNETFTIEVHQDNNCNNRIISESICSEYRNLLKDIFASSHGKADPSTASKTTDKKNKSDNTPDKSKKGIISIPRNVHSAISPSDSFLIDQVMESLSHHREICPHACGSYRLDKLLSNSNEIALMYRNKRLKHEFDELQEVKRKEFEESAAVAATASIEPIEPIIATKNTKNTKSKASKQAVEVISEPTEFVKEEYKEITNFVIEDDLAIDLRYNNPSKPIPWQMPKDISLIAALAREVNGPIESPEKSPDPKKGPKKGEKLASPKASKQTGKQAAIVESEKPRKKSNGVNKVSVDKSVLESFIQMDTQLFVTVQYHKALNDKKTLQKKLQDSSETLSIVDSTASLSKSSAALPSPKPLNPNQIKINRRTSKLDPAIVLASNIDSIYDKRHEYIMTEVLKTVDIADDAKESLAATLAITPYGRIIIVMDYDNDELLERVNELLNDVNSKALPNIQGTIQAYSLSSSEFEDLKSGKMDVLTGFMVIDDEKRVIVLEGLAYPGFSMEYVYTRMSHEESCHGPNNAHTKVLYHPNILFPQRIYPNYSPDIKRIHLRYKMKKLLLKTELYSYSQMDIECVHGIDALTGILRAEDFSTCKIFNFFPSMKALDQLELLYGEAITRIDMFGYRIEELRANKSSRLKTSENQAKTSFVDDLEDQNALDGSNGYTFKYSQRLAATNTTNEAFESHLRHRQTQPKRNHVKEQRTLAKKAYLNMLLQSHHKKQEQLRYLLALGMATRKNDGNIVCPKIFIYSTQSNNYKRQAFDNLRKILFHHREYHHTKDDIISNAVEASSKAMDWTESHGKAISSQNHIVDNILSHGNSYRKGIYTYSTDYISQTLFYEDNESIQAKRFEYDQNHSMDRHLDKSQWTTKKGFIYPASKTYLETITHPKKPSEMRIDDLKEPWLRDLYPPETIDRNSLNSEELDKLFDKEKDFRIYNKSIDVFGNLQQPQYEHEFQLALIGSKGPKELPRGKLINPKALDEKFFSSIHIGGDEHHRILEESMKKEKDDWKAKVVVDHEDFKVDGFLVKDHATSQIDRYKDILHDPPQRKALIQLREKKSSSKGLDWSYRTSPMTIINKNEPYIDNIQRQAGLRVIDKEKFVTARISSAQGTENGRIKDFDVYVKRDAIASKTVRTISTKKHPLLNRNSIECSGPKWETLSS